jgi:hypothetical protein
MFAAVPAVPVVAGILASTGALVTVRLKAWVAVPAVLVAVKVSGYRPAAAGLGVPARAAVPSPLPVNATPEGSRPSTVIAGAGEPLALTVKLNAFPGAAVP